MKIAVIPEDNTIVVDGDARKPSNPTYPPGVRAIQWADDAGAIEFYAMPQQAIASIDELAPYIAMHAAAKTRDETPPPYVAPTKEQRISHILYTQAGDRDRTTVQMVILIGEMVLAPYAAQLYGVSLEIARMGVYARNKTYRICKDAETEIEAIEEEP